MADSVRELLARDTPGGRVTVRGWLRTARHSKNLSFLEVSDGSCFAGIQAVAEPTLSNYADTVASLATGCAVELTGDLVVGQIGCRLAHQHVLAETADDLPTTISEPRQVDDRHHAMRRGRAFHDRHPSS